MTFAGLGQARDMHAVIPNLVNDSGIEPVAAFNKFALYFDANVHFFS